LVGFTLTELEAANSTPSGRLRSSRAREALTLAATAFEEVKGEIMPQVQGVGQLQYR